MPIIAFASVPGVESLIFQRINLWMHEFKKKKNRYRGLVFYFFEIIIRRIFYALLGTEKRKGSFKRGNVHEVWCKLKWVRRKPVNVNMVFFCVPAPVVVLFLA